MGKLIDKAKGKVKQAVADVTGNDELRREGVRDEIAGEVKGAIANAKESVKEAGRAIKDAVKK
jgi:uncharacterized protein YjbJ (UPF0337 family)